MIRRAYAAAVIIDIAVAWYRTFQHLAPPVLAFRVPETMIKLCVMVLALRGRRWALIAQVVLSTLAFFSGISLVRQANHRASGDPLLWISLGAQVVAGVLCAITLAVPGRQLTQEGSA